MIIVKFDSTLYLSNFLIENTSWSPKILENCMKILNGFVVIPNSLVYDDNTGTISLKAKIPNSQFCPSEISINDSSGIDIYGVIADYPKTALHLNISIDSFRSRSVLLIHDETPSAGIYYHQSTVFDKNIPVEEKLTFYDKYALQAIQNYTIQIGSTLEETIKTTSEKLYQIGLVPDKEISKKTKFENLDERVKAMNLAIRSLSKDTVTRYIDEVRIEPQEIYDPISI